MQYAQERKRNDNKEINKVVHYANDKLELKSHD